MKRVKREYILVDVTRPINTYHIPTAVNVVIVITFYSPSCLGQKTAKGPFGLPIKLPHAHLSTTHG